MFGLATGLLTGLFFERRATRAAQDQNEELRAQMETLKATIYSLGGRAALERVDADLSTLPEDVVTRAAGAQDASGRVDRQALVAHFVQQGHNRREVEQAIASMCESGAAVGEGRWLQMV